MGKSPGKWIKTVLFGKKKSSKSNLSKDSTLMKKISVTVNSHSEDLGSITMVISSPVRHVINASGEHTQLEKSSSANLMHDNPRNTIGFTAANDDELIRLEQAATKAQAAFRGYLARRAFWALKGIIRLQAVARGHLVRRQAVATLTCMRAIVEFQALVRGQRVRRFGNGPQALQKRAHGHPLHKERANLLQISLKSEELSNNAFGVKLVTSSKTTTPLNIHYDPDDPNSVNNWLERWSSSNFWDPLPPQPKKTINITPKRKQTKSQETTTRTKRSIRKVPAPSLDNNNNSSNNENETNGKVENAESNDKENQKTRRRKSLPAKQECYENVIQNTPTLPSYMAATESAKAKLRAQAAAKAAEDGVENGFVRRHSLPDTTGKLGLQSPRVQKLLHANGKGVSKTKKPQISPGDEKVVSAGWKS
ncbi:putative IQ motif, EF-hand binding protein [Helianthus annuus]|nr:putative IQ motif, EF-hand binding protein [Helianthus annuus]